MKDRSALLGIVTVLTVALAAGVSASATSPLAGQWRGKLATGEGRTSELIVDLGMLDNRWVGQFDLHDFGVADYPVEVIPDGRNVTLRFSSAQTDFAGTLSADGKTLAGMAIIDERRDSLVLERIGEPRFSEEFLAFEKLADDPSRVEVLSADAAALRKRFNDDRASARLVMLLAPS